MAAPVDVLICGSGSAGVCAAAWLARYGVSYRVLERRSGPLVVGQADGVQCRTVEVYESFGIVETLLKEAYHVLEMVFWAADGHGGIRRTRAAADTPPGLSHLPHVILNQARMNQLLLDAARAAGGSPVDYGYEVVSVAVDPALVDDATAHAVTVWADGPGGREPFQAKYVLACDGAHSAVRKSLGFRMVGDSSDVVWGVMDVYPQTTFPDVRKKTLLKSDAGSLLIIPREGGSLARFYIELPPGVAARTVTLAQLQHTARRIFQPYPLEFARDVVWWSAYGVGQRLADHFDQDLRVFLAGDACHTHSPKAGQGMNVSLQDGHNLGWKLGAVLTGRATPAILQTYVDERRDVAKTLLAFDQQWVKIFYSTTTDGGAEPLPPDLVAQTFLDGARFTAGLTVQYADSLITSANTSAVDCARHITVGMRFPSAQVVRLADARPLQLAQMLRADGRWRLVIFAGRIGDAARERLHQLATALDGPGGLVQLYTEPAADVDSFVEPLVVMVGNRGDLDFGQIPSYFWPATGPWQVRDVHKVFVDDESYNAGHGHAYDTYGIDHENGAAVIVRPDQHVAGIYASTDVTAIQAFFDGFVRPRQPPA